MNKIKTFLKKQYVVYHLRWQLSALIMMVPMMALELLGFPLWLNLMTGQFLGALIFWKIDQYIFHKHTEDNIEHAINEVVEKDI